ncbi:unnamed protein product (macronuclear) [Paramecium tetraurelia]|uniref:Cyclic nucleotide-binding domain-containing protein n=1 Tax=Paramecium tetraurelia TaxID=5888 RepID=A0E5V4_PARTE|nr:uncharacterized protein GSPATT00003533001 [Paramecium tetraurelia]CAK90671.1 unnamed protein product [Paramecium tetraurelia]|eukprot:XP_001458068.1 hypothetical protein (macronuclear) [Paramecium tetraurelia strain d4-2]
MSNHSKRSTLMKCNTMKAPKQLRKAKSFYSQAETFQLSNQVDGTDEKLKKLEQSFHNQSDYKIMQSQTRFNKTLSVHKKNNIVAETIIPEWLKSRKDFQQICYTETINDLLSVPKIILKQQRNTIEDQKIKDWIQNKVYGLPDELYKDITQIMTTRVFAFEEIFDVDHNITVLYEGKVQRVNKDLGFPINGPPIKVGEFLSDEYLYMVKTDVIIVEIPKIELMQLMDGFKISKLEQFVQQMKQFPAFKSIKKNSLHKIITRGQLQLIIKNYQRFQRASNQEYLNILFYGKLQLNLRKLISKMNKWPIAQNQWETKTYYQYQDRILELESLNCFGLTDDQYTISTKESCVLLQIRRNILETILTTEQINDLKQSIDIFKKESKSQWRERMRRKFDQELIQQKLRMEKVMIALLNN